MARRRFFVDQVHRGEATLTGEEAEHLTRVLRVEVGQRFEISDNRQVYLAQVVEARKQRVRFETVETLPVAEPPVRVTLYTALIKFDRFEWMVEKATELGVDRVVPVRAERSDRGLDRAVEKRLTRWCRIAKEASQQARRAHLPDVAPLTEWRDVLMAQDRYRYFLDEADGRVPLGSALPPAAERTAADDVGLLIGPEGGWTDRERENAAEGDFRPVSLGQEILRAETAALAALVLVRHAWWVSGRLAGNGTIH